ncbi:MAG: malectin [Acidobacteriota bacterium]|nr:malectin [Acidobacteriota bacterium]
MKFADYTFKEPGHYDFDVLLNGAKVLKNFDFDTVYGPCTAVDKGFETSVTSESLRYKSGFIMIGTSPAASGVP